MSKISVFSVITAGLCTLGFGAPATAQDKPADGRPPWVVACEADMKKHCEAEMKANGDVRPCLAKKETELSEDCQRVFVRQYKVLESCKDDISKFCPDGNSGKGLKQCFQENADKMSEKCRSALSKGSKAHEKAQAAAAKTEAPTSDKPVAKKKAKKPAPTP